jgi:methionyl-tRNA synthetase
MTVQHDLDALSRKHLTSPKTFHVTPVCLVPNGRAHLGHVAGPILKADIINRALRVQAHDSLMISCTDPDELHVVIKALQLREEPSALARRFHEAIEADFRSLLIDFDSFIDPRDARWEARYLQINRQLIDEVVERGNAKIREEVLPSIQSVGENYRRGPHVPREGEYLVGGWIKGRCSFCDADLVGFFCESCGSHFAHEEVDAKSSVYFDAVLADRPCRSLYLELQEPEGVLARLKRMGFRQSFMAMIERYVARCGAAIRLTLPTTWGVSYQHEQLDGHHVIFTYSGVLYGCHILAGEAFRELSGSPVNPLSRQSDVVNILTFGIDNVVPFALGVTALGLAQGTYKPIDCFVPNYFYHLNGSKFSTSRGHVIWAGDIAGISGLQVDCLRKYLAATSPDEETANFDVEAFVESHNDDVKRLMMIMERGRAIADGPARAMSSRAAEMAERWIAQFCSSYALSGNFNLARCAAMTDAVLNDLLTVPGEMDADMGALLKLACVTLHPIMPGITGEIWRTLGQQGALSLANLSQSIVQRADWPILRRLSRIDLDSCLPRTLRWS